MAKKKKVEPATRAQTLAALSTLLIGVGQMHELCGRPDQPKLPRALGETEVGEMRMAMAELVGVLGQVIETLADGSPERERALAKAWIGKSYAMTDAQLDAQIAATVEKAIG